MADKLLPLDVVTLMVPIVPEYVPVEDPNVPDTYPYTVYDDVLLYDIEMLLNVIPATVIEPKLVGLSVLITSPDWV